MQPVKHDVAGPAERQMRPKMRKRLYEWVLRTFRKREPILRRCAMRALSLLQAPPDAGEQVDVGTKGNLPLHLVAYDKAHLVGRYPVAFTHKKRMILKASVNEHVLIRSICANLKGLARTLLSRRKRAEYRHLCVFSNIWSKGYFHWTLDDLTRLEALQQFRKHTNTPVQLLMVPPVRVWQLDSLRAMGFGEEDLVIWDGGKARVEKLYVTPGRRADKDAIEWLRRHAAEYAGCREETAASKRIYISRADADERQVVNEQEFFSSLEARGFELFRLSELDYRAQVRLFWEADFVVGPHGAGLTNLVYSRPGATLIELSPSREIRGHFQRLCDDLGLAYERTLCQTIGSSLIVDIDEVLPLIDRLLQKQRPPGELLDGSK